MIQFYRVVVSLLGVAAQTYGSEITAITTRQAECPRGALVVK
jgi:hypothetical protein